MSRDPPSPAKTPLPADGSEVREQLARLREQQEQLCAQLHSGEQHFKQLARSVWRVQEDERRRLARELHDGIGQHLTALRHRLDVMARSEAVVASSNGSLQQAQQLCEVAIQETRALSRLLRPQILDDLGLEAALRWLARHTAEGSDSSIEVEVGVLPFPVDNDLSTLLFRVAQEALANAQKHAHARNVVLRLSHRADQLQLLIVDDGCGCDVTAAFAKSSNGHSTGLASIRERVRLFGGRFSLISQPDEGLQLRVILPFSADESTP
ncbi:MAG: sensor histidine kinase [Dokdonella sp.]